MVIWVDICNIIKMLQSFFTDVCKKIALRNLLGIFHCIFVRGKLYWVRKAVKVDALSI